MLVIAFAILLLAVVSYFLSRGEAPPRERALACLKFGLVLLVGLSLLPLIK